MEPETEPIERVATVAIDLLPSAPGTIATLDEVLDATTIVSVCHPEATTDEWIDGWVDAVQSDVTGAVRARGDARRAPLLHAKELLTERLAELQSLRDELPVHERAAEELQTRIDDLQTQIERLQSELNARRKAEIGKRLEDQLQQLESERLEAHDKLRKIAFEDFEEQKKTWEESASQRPQRIAELQQVAGSLRTIAEETGRRAASLNEKLVTKTVAGFLTWAGYASIAATGAVFAQLIDPNFTIDWVLGTARAFADAPRAAVSRFSVVLFLLATCVAIIVVATSLVDRIMGRFDPRWHRRDRNQRDARTATTQFGGQGITRRSYFRLLASAPYVLTACVVVALVAAGNARENVFQHLLTTVTNTAIGSTIAILATAVLMMYAIRVIEPRDREQPFTKSWEFAIAPLAMIFAVGFATWAAADRRWALWLLFMLLASLALAYGLVFHGVYKDAEKAEQRLDETEALIRFYLNGPERPELPATAQQKLFEIEARYARDRSRLEEIGRRSHLGVSNHPRRATEEATRQWYSPSRWIHGRRKREDISVDLSGIDESVARDLVETIAVENRAKDRLEERKRKVDAQIREIELATSLDARHRLQQELANTSGQIDVLTATDAELIARVAKGADELRLRICSQSAAARSIRSSMQTVIGKPAGSAIVHARPQLSSGDNHE